MKRKRKKKRLPVLPTVSITVIRHYDKNQLEEDRLFHFVACSSLSREIKTGTNAGAMEEHYLPDCSPRLVQLISHILLNNLTQKG